MGVAMGITFCNALKVAVDTVGADKINGEAIYKAYQEIGGKSNDGLMGVCTYGPKSRVATKSVKIYQVKNSKIVPITGWVETPNAVGLHKF